MDFGLSNFGMNPAIISCEKHIIQQKKPTPKGLAFLFNYLKLSIFLLFMESEGYCCFFLKTELKLIPKPSLNRI
ncbi:MAG: hypothetical protein ACJAWV_002709 [Flammeovirgaceae bacterium]